MIDQVLILCGGKSTRFGNNKHKFLSDLNGKPILQHLIQHYISYGCKEIFLASGHNYYEVANFVNSIYKLIHPIKIYCFWTGDDSGTAYRIFSMKEFFNNPFYLTYADALSDIDLESLSKMHFKSGNILTITGISPKVNFGVLHYSTDNQIIRFEEKPVLRNTIASGGFFVCDPAIYNYIPWPCSEDKSFEIDVIPNVVNDNKCGIYIHNGFWKCLDTQKDYEELREVYKCTNH